MKTPSDFLSLFLPTSNEYDNDIAKNKKALIQAYWALDFSVSTYIDSDNTEHTVLTSSGSTRLIQQIKEICRNIDAKIGVVSLDDINNTADIRDKIRIILDDLMRADGIASYTDFWGTIDSDRFVKCMAYKAVSNYIEYLLNDSISTKSEDELRIAVLTDLITKAEFNHITAVRRIFRSANDIAKTLLSEMRKAVPQIFGRDILLNASITNTDIQQIINTALASFSGNNKFEHDSITLNNETISEAISILNSLIVQTNISKDHIYGTTPSAANHTKIKPILAAQKELL